MQVVLQVFSKPPKEELFNHEKSDSKECKTNLECRKKKEQTAVKIGQSRLNMQAVLLAGCLS